MVQRRAGGRQLAAAGPARRLPGALNRQPGRLAMAIAGVGPGNLHQQGVARVPPAVAATLRPRAQANPPALLNRRNQRPVRPQRRSVTPRPGAAVRFLVENRFFDNSFSS